MDMTNFSDDELVSLAQDVQIEQRRRRTVEQAPRVMEQLTSELLNALGRSPGSPWVQPQGAHDAYPQDWIVTHKDQTWRSTVPANVWEPAGTGVPEGLWTLVQATPDPDPTSPTTPDPEPTEPKVPEESQLKDWHQPLPAEAYQIGAMVKHNGHVWRCAITNNVWEPGAYGWDQLS